MFVSPRLVLAASALLLSALPILAGEEISPIAPVTAPTAIVKCPGITSVPFTVDAEQALPLRSAGSLACGDVVTILSDSEGYTTHIRTPEGKDGYVARMYLGAESASPVVAAKLPPSVATPVNGVVRWQAGAPGCDQFLSHGRNVESITANGITVQVSLQDTGWKFRANVAISNLSDTPMSIMPGIVTLDELQPHLQTLMATDSGKIAHTSTHQVLWTLANAVPSPSASAAKLLHTPDSDRLGYRTSPTPDYMSPHMVLASDRPGAFARSESIDVESITLKPMSLPAGERTAGVMWFDRDAGARELSMRVPVGDMVFDFSFAFDQKR